MPPRATSVLFPPLCGVAKNAMPDLEKSQPKVAQTAAQQVVLRCKLYRRVFWIVMRVDKSLSY
jgi:hypothetical protein